MNGLNQSILKFVNAKNKKKIFTPGPGSLLSENILGLGPFFGRGDIDYLLVEEYVMKSLKKISGFNKIVSFQGSGTLAIEMAFQNFLKGKILIINSGYYSLRLLKIAKILKKNFNQIKKINVISWKKLNKIKGKYNWICTSYVETSKGLKLPIKELFKLKKSLKSKLMLDATGSIGLENEHNLADLISFSSCKGLFGLTGASFIAYKSIKRNKVNSFYLDLDTHIKKKVTGPYHTIGSLYYVFKNFKEIKNSVLKNKKKFIKNNLNNIIYSNKYQPLLCTFVKKKYKPKKNIILYKPRIKTSGSIVCHLGETYLKKKSSGKIQDNLVEY